MNKEAKVKINLNSKREAVNPPVQFCKAKTKPDARQFSFIAKAFTQLDESVVAVRWNSVAKQLDVTIQETPTFDAIRWLKYLADQQHEIEKSPFVDMNTSAVLLTFKDEEGNDAATVRFKNLQVVRHECSLFKASTTSYGVDATAQSLTHFVTLSYQFSEFGVVEKQIEFKDDAEIESLEDKEWQTVETP